MFVRATSVKLLILFFAVAVGTRAQSSADVSRLYISKTEPVWGDTIRIGYSADPDSVAASLNLSEPIYCAALVQTAWGPKNSVQKMKRVANSNRLECNLRIPDSTYSIRIEVCRVHERLPDGIAIISVLTHDAKKAPGEILQNSTAIDSAVQAELSLYPNQQTIYIKAVERKISVLEKKAKKLSVADERAIYEQAWTALNSKPSNSTAFWITELVLAIRMQKTAQEIALLAKKVARNSANEEILYQERFWNSLFYPRMVNGIMKLDDSLGLLFTPLALKFPHSEMARMWLKRCSNNKLVIASAYRDVAMAWSNSNDVELLMSMTAFFSKDEASPEDRSLALRLIERARSSSEKGTAFYSGENIFSSMGHSIRIETLRIRALSNLKRFKEATDLGIQTLEQCKRVEEKSAVYTALMQTFLADNNMQLAERQLAILLGLNSRRDQPEIDRIYQVRKQSNETISAYLERIRKDVDVSDVLPPVKDFHYLTTAGKSGSIAALRGKFVVLDFWFVGCPGCEVEHKSLDSMARTLQSDTSVVLLSVALNDARALEHYFKTTDPIWPAVPSGNEICELVGIQGYPTHVILDRNGKTVCWESGGAPNSGDRLLQRLREVQASAKK